MIETACDSCGRTYQSYRIADRYAVNRCARCDWVADRGDLYYRLHKVYIAEDQLEAEYDERYECRPERGWLPRMREGQIVLSEAGAARLLEHIKADMPEGAL